MDITRENFVASLERVRAAISRSTFLALDCEFSGLSRGGSTCQYDTPEERYTHLRETASGFLIIQFGLAAFTLEREKSRYTQETFNFYLFPRDSSHRTFLCQPSSLEFLISNGFDFNRLIRDGVSHMRPAEVEQLREKLERRLQEADSPAASAGAAAAPAPAPVPDDQKEFVDKAISQIEKFLESSDEQLDFHNLNPFQRKLLYDHVPSRVQTALELETTRGARGQRTLRVGRRLSGEDRRRRDRRRLEQQVDEAAGFSQVITAISQSGKPVVGHNMLLDLVHIVEQFVCPLPETFADFKSVVHCVFPTLVDSKVMGSTQPFRDLVPSTALGEMATCLATHPFSVPSVVAAGVSCGPEYGLKDSKHHEAGYDAFLTACCFASMVSYLGLLLKPPQPLLEPSADIVRPFKNKIFAMRMADLPYLNLTGEDLAPSRDHVFFLTFPSSWKTSDLVQLFSPFSRVHVAWLDDTSAFVSLDRRDQASQVLQNVKATGLFTLCTYSEWQARQRMSRGRGQKATVSSESPAGHAPGGEQRTPPVSGVLAAADSCSPAPPSRATRADRQSPASGGRPDGLNNRTSGGGGGNKAERGGPAAGRSEVTSDGSSPAAAQTQGRSAARKRKRGTSGSSDNGTDDQNRTGSKISTDVFAVPDW